MLSFKPIFRIFLTLVLVTSLASPAHAFWPFKRNKHKTFEIHMKVDFGPAGKEGYDGELTVEKGMTAKEAVSQLYPVMSGKTCCSIRDTREIGGVRVDPAKNRWWTCMRNGSRKFSPSRSKLKKGDRIEWKYIQEEQ